MKETPEHKGQYARIMSDCNATACHIKCLHLIASNTDKNNACYLTNEQIGEALRVSKGTASNAVSWLEKNNYIGRKIYYKEKSKEIAYRATFIMLDPIHPASGYPIHPVDGSKPPKGVSPENQDLSGESGVSEDSFKELWKDYTLTFLKAQGRAGGLKANALKGYKSLIKFGASVEEIYKYCEHHAGMKFGHKDLERLLRVDLYKQYLEDVK